MNRSCWICWILKEVHEMLDFCFLFPTLDQHFSVQAGRLTSLGSVLHEDGPLGWVKIVQWFFAILSLFLGGVFPMIWHFFCWFFWGCWANTRLERQISLGLVDHSIERESLVLLPGGFVLVGVFGEALETFKADSVDSPPCSENAYEHLCTSTSF